MEGVLRNKRGDFASIKPKLLTDKPSDKLAEFIGIMLGDGNIWYQPGYYCVRVFGHIKNDRKYLLNFFNPLAYELFGLKFNIYEEVKYSKISLVKYNKDLVYTLRKFGLRSGDKIKNGVDIPRWIFESKDYLRACIRGLIDTDGSVVPITGRDYTYIWFSSASEKLRRDFQKAMKILGYKIAKWNFTGTPKTYIGKKELLRKYYKEVNFSNLKHRKRFMLP